MLPLSPLDPTARCWFPRHAERLLLTACLASRIWRGGAWHRGGVSGLDQSAASIRESPAADFHPPDRWHRHYTWGLLDFRGDWTDHRGMMFGILASWMFFVVVFFYFGSKQPDAVWRLLVLFSTNWPSCWLYQERDFVFTWCFPVSLLFSLLHCSLKYDYMKIIKFRGVNGLFFYFGKGLAICFPPVFMLS